MRSADILFISVKRVGCFLFTVVVMYLAFAVPALAQSRGEPFFNPRFEEKRKEDARAKKKLVVPSFSRYVKTMREICQALAADGRLQDFQKIAGAQPNFSTDCPSCRPFFRIWYSSCQLSGTGNLKFSPPEEPTPIPVESQIVPTVGAGAQAGEVGTPAPVDSRTPSVAPESSPTVVPSSTEAPLEEVASTETEDSGEEDEEDEEAGDDEPKPTATPTIRPIGPERDPNIVLIDLVSRLSQNITEAPGVEFSMMAMDLFASELRNPTGKTESTHAYFDTLAEFMLAPFEEIREELQENLDAQKGKSEEARPDANVDEMFDF